MHKPASPDRSSTPPAGSDGVGCAASKPHAAPRVPRTLSAPLAQIADAIGRLAAGWKRRRQTREAHLALRELDDHLLRDLGLERSRNPLQLTDLIGDADGAAASAQPQQKPQVSPRR